MLETVKRSRHVAAGILHWDGVDAEETVLLRPVGVAFELARLVSAADGYSGLPVGSTSMAALSVPRKLLEHLSVHVEHRGAAPVVYFNEAVAREPSGDWRGRGE